MHNSFRFSFLVIAAGVFSASFAEAQAFSVRVDSSPADQGFLFVNAATAQDEVVEGSKQFISSMAQKAITFLGDEKLSHAQRKEKFRQLLRANYDMKTIGRFALGTYWKAATPAQQSEYLRLFENMVVEVYSQRFADYKGQALEVSGGRTEGKSDILVNSLIVPKEGGDKIKVDWRVRKKEGQYKVIDVIVEGVSMALTQRSDFASVIQRGGGDLDVLIAHLRSGNNPKEEKSQ